LILFWIPTLASLIDDHSLAVVRANRFLQHPEIFEEPKNLLTQYNFASEDSILLN